MGLNVDAQLDHEAFAADGHVLAADPDLNSKPCFIPEIVRVLKVEPQSPPYIFRTDGSRYPDKAGLSGWIPLVESGIQIHTLAPKEFISIDIYSCRRFDIEPLKAFVRSYFSPRRMDEQFLERGMDYHKA